MLLSTYKVFVFETLAVLSITRFIKVVHVELADEAREVVVLEVSWQDVLCKLVRLIYNEAGARSIPRYSRMICRILYRDNQRTVINAVC